MRVLALTRQNPGSIPIVLGIAVISLAIAIPASGVRPYGEQTILERIDHEDNALCIQFGLPVRTTQFADCMIALAGLRQHHVDMLTSDSWL